MQWTSLEISILFVSTIYIRFRIIKSECRRGFSAKPHDDILEITAAINCFSPDLFTSHLLEWLTNAVWGDPG